MIDYAKRLRGPGLVAVLVVLVAYLVLAVVQFVILVNRGTALAMAAQLAGSATPSLIWVFVTLALALACVLVRPQVADGQRLVGAAAILVSLATALALVFWVLGLVDGLTLGVALAAIGGLVETLAKGACALVLWRLRGLGAEEVGRLQAALPSTGDDGGRLPVYGPQQAVGLQWSRAGDAASGAGAAAANGPTQTPAELEAAPEPEPVRKQLWSRGGISPEQLPPVPASGAVPPTGPPAPAEPILPWTTAAQAAEGHDAGPTQIAPPSADRPRRQAPDWTPAPRPEAET